MACDGARQMRPAMLNYICPMWKSRGGSRNGWPRTLWDGGMGQESDRKVSFAPSFRTF